MARMIPSMISEEDALKSRAEAKIFGWLRNMSWGNATVLHSLPLKDHIKKSFGEIDFVVICEKGVLCLEIKGGGVERKDGHWGFTNGKKETNWKTEGPYEQAQGNMKSLRDYLEKHLDQSDDILKCRFACCVMTPDCVIESDSDVAVIPEITFNARMSEKDMPAIFERSFNYWEKQKRYGGHENLSRKAIDRLTEFLRGDFSFIPPLSVTLSQSDDQLNSTTEEQQEIIVSMMVNDRMMVEGGAGTGKTFLAAEQCRKSCLTGEKVLYLCYNKMIASYVAESLHNNELYADVDVYTFHELLCDICGIRDDSEKDDNFFNNILPDRFMELCADGLSEEYTYDRVIIDEGQDLMNSTAYLCINEIIKGGWDRGKWTIYYDVKQNIFGTNKEFRETWEELKKSAFIYPLTVNCRNTKQIAQGNFAVTHIYKAVIMRAEGEDIVYKTYKDKKSEAKMVFDGIRRLKNEGISKKDIIILSYYRMDNPNSCLYGVDIPSDIGAIQFNPTGSFSSNRNIRYFTIKAFKGMESKAIIMIDVDSFTDEEKRLQNYVGMSRARTYLEFYYDEKLANERQMRLVESLTM